MKTKILDINCKYYGLEPRILMENAGNGVSSIITSKFGKLQDFYQRKIELKSF